MKISSLKKVGIHQRYVRSTGTLPLMAGRPHEDVFEVHGHGIKKKVSSEDIEALTEYVTLYELLR